DKKVSASSFLPGRLGWNHQRPWKFVNPIKKLIRCKYRCCRCHLSSRRCARWSVTPMLLKARGVKQPGNLRVCRKQAFPEPIQNSGGQPKKLPKSASSMLNPDERRVGKEGGS